MKMRYLLGRGKWKYEQQKPQSGCSALEYGRRMFLLCSLAVLLNACSLFPSPSQSGNGSNSQDLVSSTPTRLVFLTPTMKPTTISLQVLNCPSTLSLNWDSLVGTKAGINKVQRVMCGNIEGGALAALVVVRYYSSDSRMDFYIYDNLVGAPHRRFSVTGLIEGDAQISPTNTIITAENADNDPLGVDLFKEYQWDGSTYVQVLFPGIYPDVTHYQAEQSQSLVNAQLAQATATPTAPHNAWQDSAFPVVNKLSQDVFHWLPSQVTDSVVTYNARSGIYVIKATNDGPGGGGFIASLFRLDDIQTNIFEVKQVTSIDGTALLSSPVSGVQLTNPVKVSASYKSIGIIVGRVVLYSDAYVMVGDSNAIHGSASTGFVNFNLSVSYHLPTHGLQEGVVAFYSSNQNSIAITNQVVMIKVLLAT